MFIILKQPFIANYPGNKLASFKIVCDIIFYSPAGAKPVPKTTGLASLVCLAIPDSLTLLGNNDIFGNI